MPYETIVRAASKEPEAVDEVLQHYSRASELPPLKTAHQDRKAGKGFLFFSEITYHNSLNQLFEKYPMQTNPLWALQKTGKNC